MQIAIMTDQKIGNLVLFAAAFDANSSYMSSTEKSLIKRVLYFNPFTGDGQRVIADCLILGMAGFFFYNFYNEFTKTTRKSTQKRVSFQCTNDCCVQTDNVSIESREIQTDSIPPIQEPSNVKFVAKEPEEYEHLN